STPTSVVKSVHSTMAKQLLSQMPHDYIYPVCYLIAFKLVPIDSSHTFCIRCLAKLQHQLKDDCPQCGQSVLITATRQNIDISLYNQMLLYLPEETKVKQSANKKSTMEKFSHLNIQRKSYRL
ncbi:hypothetical protein V1517DRAFT_266740, partial [Lipomyces orientalis]